MVEAGTVSSNYSRLSICQMFLFLETLLWLRFPSFLPVYIKQRERWMTFIREFFAFINSGLALFLGRSYLTSITSLLVAIDSSKNSIHYRGQVEAYLELSRTSTMVIFCENIYRHTKPLTIVITIHEKASSYIIRLGSRCLSGRYW